jgi:hypothetical protein
LGVSLSQAAPNSPPFSERWEAFFSWQRGSQFIALDRKSTISQSSQESELARPRVSRAGCQAPPQEVTCARVRRAHGRTQKRDVSSFVQEYLGPTNHRPENILMATDGNIVTKEWEPAAQAFVQHASAEQLHQIVGGTTLTRHPRVSHPQGTAEQQTEGLRKLITQKMRRHADFRGMVIRLIARGGLVSAPGKEAKKEAPVAAEKEATGGQERKSKKEEKGEQPAKK